LELLIDESSTVSNALTLLDVVAEKGPINATQLSRTMLLDRTAVRRLLTTLHSRGFIMRIETDYVLGPSLIRLSDRFAPAFRDIALPTMSALAAEVGETVLCHFRQRDDAIVLAQVVGVQHPVRVEEELGRQYPLHLGAGGLAILAAMVPAEASKVLKSVPEGEVVEEELIEARKRGYVVSRGKRRAGVSGIAAAVLNNTGQPICSLSIVVPDQRADVVPGLVPSLLAAAASLADFLDGADEMVKPPPRES
jgi:DNA-binding IclR family transcriptional regulator